MYALAHSAVLMFVSCTLLFETSVGFLGASLTPVKAAMLLLAVFASTQFAFQRRPFPGGIKNMWLVVFMMSCVLSGLYSFLQGTELAHLRTAFSTWPGIFILYGLLSYCILSPKHVELVLVAHIVGGLILVATQFLGVGFAVETVHGDRVGGIGGNPNEAAAHLSFVLPIAVAFGFSSRAYWKRILAWGCCAVIALGILTTLSRSGFLAIGAMSATWIIRTRRFDVLKFVIPAVLALPVLVLAVPGDVSSRLKALSPEYMSRDVTALSRLDKAGYSMIALASNPAIGIGTTRFVQWVRETGLNTSEDTTVHNIEFLLLAEQGLMGFIPFVAIVFLSWRAWARAGRARSLFEEHGDEEYLLLAQRCWHFQIGFIGFMVVGQFQPLLQDKQMWFAFALATAIDQMVAVRVAALASAQTSSSEETPEASRLPQFGDPIPAGEGFGFHSG